VLRGTSTRGNRLNFRFASVVRWHSTTKQLAGFISKMRAPAIDRGVTMDGSHRGSKPLA
jgi:hypothetical protein